MPLLTKILFSFFILGFVSNIYAQSAKEAQHSLKKVSANIKQVETNLKQAQADQQKLLSQLKDNEVNGSQIALQAKQITTQLNQQENKLSHLTQQKTQLNNQLQKQQQHAIQVLNNAYRMGQLQTFKVLLNQQNPAEFSRTMIYYDYILKARQQILANTQKTLIALNQNEADIQQTQSDLLLQKNNLQVTQKSWTLERQQRQKIIADLNQNIASNQNKLNELNQQRNNLTQTIQKLAEVSTTAPAINFNKKSGKYYWPTTGRIISDFGENIQQSELRANGMVIAANMGQNIYAIAPGKVVFSDWLAGYGLMLIIDHGNGYMSIYGRNNAITVKKGERVSAGQIIATVGDSGGFTQPGLYFALRYNGKPMDPTRFCQPVKNGYTSSFG